YTAHYRHLSFCGPLLPPHLHSFPTRRSSDLIQEVLDKYCVAGVHINAESRVKVAEGPAKKELIQQGWRTFLVKVHNEAGITPKLDRKSTRLNSSHVKISYAVFCLKKKKPKYS